MTGLLNKKKSLEDSVKIYNGNEMMYKDSAKRVAYATHDSLKYTPLIDSESKYWNLARLCTQQVTAVNFSIDSLSKMK